MIVNRRLLPHLDWPLIAAVMALALIGLATIYSVTWNITATQPGGEFWRQMYALPVAMLALIVCLMIDYRTLAQRSPWILLALLLSLGAVLLFGDKAKGARRWIDVEGDGQRIRRPIPALGEQRLESGIPSARQVGADAGELFEDQVGDCIASFVLNQLRKERAWLAAHAGDDGATTITG